MVVPAGPKSTDTAPTVLNARKPLHYDKVGPQRGVSVGEQDTVHPAAKLEYLVVLVGF